MVKKPPANARDTDTGFIPGWEDPLEEKWQPAPIVLPGKFHGQRSLVSVSSWGHKQSDTTEHALTNNY